MDNGVDFVVEKDLGSLVRGMNALTGDGLIDEDALRREITARDREIANPFTKDLQITAIRGARSYLGDKLIRTATPHRILD
ncbi:FAD-binding dehydrogenase, partial [Streptomyces sp. DT225]